MGTGYYVFGLVQSAGLDCCLATIGEFCFCGRCHQFVVFKVVQMGIHDLLSRIKTLYSRFKDLKGTSQNRKQRLSSNLGVSLLSSSSVLFCGWKIAQFCFFIWFDEDKFKPLLPGLCAPYDYVQGRKLEEASQALEIFGGILFEHAFDLVPIRVLTCT